MSPTAACSAQATSSTPRPCRCLASRSAKYRIWSRCSATAGSSASVTGRTSTTSPALDSVMSTPSRRGYPKRLPNRRTQRNVADRYPDPHAGRARRGVPAGHRGARPGAGRAGLHPLADRAAGVGKTALLEYAAGAAGGLSVLRATGVEFEARFAWGGMHQLLRPVLGQLAGLPDEQAAALRGALRLGPATGDDPFLVSLAVLTVLPQAAGSSGLVCLVDDVQWLDDQSADALRFVARRLARDPIGLLVTARDQPASRFAPDPWPRLDVRSLDPAGMGELLDRRAGGTVARDVRERLLRYAGGNPLALLEMVANLSADELAGRRPLPDPLPLSAGLEAAFLHQ